MVQSDAATSGVIGLVVGAVVQSDTATSGVIALAVGVVVVAVLLGVGWWWLHR